MTQPVQEPTDQRYFSSLQFGTAQLRRRPGGGGGAVPGAWQDPNLVNDWAQPPDGYEEHQYRMWSDGALEFKGMLDGGAADSGTVAYTLATGYEPQYNGQETLSFGTSAFSDTLGVYTVYVEIDAATGDVTIWFCLCVETS